MKKMMSILLISCSMAMLGSVTHKSTESRSKDPVFEKDSVSKIESVNAECFTLVANDVAPVMVSDSIVAGKEVPVSTKALLNVVAITPENLRIRYGLANKEFLTRKLTISHDSTNSKARFRDSTKLSLNYNWQFGSYLRC